MSMNPFDALGLPARPDLTDEQVRAAWRAIAAATHPDRADGGDLARYTAASAAYAELRTPWSRSEAFADLTGPGRRRPAPRPSRSPRRCPPSPPKPCRPPRPGRRSSRCGSSRPGSAAAARCAWPSAPAFAAALSLAVLQLIPGMAAALADITGLITWFVLTGRRDLAAPPER